MDIEQIRDANNAVPFRPYELHRTDGKIAYVAHPDFIALSARGTHVVVINPDNRTETIDVRQIVALHSVANAEA